MIKTNELRGIASRVDSLAKNSQPYSLMFYNNSAEHPLSNEQRNELEKHLAYRFHTVWAETWLYELSDDIRVAVGDKRIHEEEEIKEQVTA